MVLADLSGIKWEGQGWKQESHVGSYYDNPDENESQL